MIGLELTLKGKTHWAFINQYAGKELGNTWNLSLLFSPYWKNKYYFLNVVDVIEVKTNEWKQTDLFARKCQLKV